MLTKNRVIQLLVMLLLLIGLVIWKTYSTNIDGKKVILNVTVLQRCDDIKTCALNPSAKYWLQIDEDPIKAEQWIHFSLHHKDNDAQVISALIFGESMYMGETKLDFITSGINTWQAKTILGACTMKVMNWALQIKVKRQGKFETLLFSFSIRQ